jgi:hypothetical protein
MAKEIRLLVKAGPHDRKSCPVCVNLPALDSKPAAFALRDAAGKLIPAQESIECRCGGKGEGGPCITWIVDEMKAGEEKTYTVELLDKVSATAVSVKDNEQGKVDITIGGKLFTTYRYQDNPARPCFFPLLGPGDLQVTRSWPISNAVPGETEDHKHHRSMWMAHGDVNGVDNWSEEPNHGFQLHQGFNQLVSGPVFGVLEAKNDWTSHDKKRVCQETRRLTVYTQPDDSRLFDLAVTFLASDGDLKFGDTKEGGILAMRIATSMDGNHSGKIVNSYGAIAEEECWGKQAHWCDYSGLVKEQEVGITLMDYPRNLRFPVYWHVRNYGMYTANPFGLKDFYDDPTADGSHLLPAGKTLTFRYRAFLHKGDAAGADSAGRYHDYVNPPQAEILGE